MRSLLRSHLEVRTWPVCLLLGVCCVAPLRADEAEERLDTLSPVALVAALGDDSYARRESARQELVLREDAAREALEAGLKSDDLEVRYHCQQLLVDIRERQIARQLDAFVKEPDKEKQYDFPAWPQTKGLLGDTEQTRQFYVDMYRAEPETLRLLEAGDAALASHIDARTRMFVQRRPQNLYQTPLVIGNIAALLLAGGHEKTELSATARSYLYNLCNQPVFREAMASDKSPVLKKLVAQYVLSSDDMGAYQGMMLCTQLEMNEEGLACADRLLAGKTVNPHYKQYAVLTIARLGSDKHLEVLKPLLEEKLVIANYNINNKMYKTELRDVALFATVQLSKEDPTKFGFDRYKPTVNSKGMANASLLGFENDELRGKAFESWKKHVDEQAKVAEGK